VSIHLCMQPVHVDKSKMQARPSVMLLFRHDYLCLQLPGQSRGMGGEGGALLYRLELGVLI
jgi:hypothetical protein